MYGKACLLFVACPLLTQAFVPCHSPRSLSQRSELYFGDFFNFNKSPKEDLETPTAPEEKSNDEKVEAAYDDEDPVEKMFSFFFGAKEEKPMGMARFGKERFPEVSFG